MLVFTRVTKLIHYISVFVYCTLNLGYVIIYYIIIYIGTPIAILQFSYGIIAEFERF